MSARRTARSGPSTASAFEVRRGEIFGLLGPNGAGKTTTVEMLEGLRKPDAGQLEILGIDAVSQPDALKERIGVTLQTAELYPKLTVIEVLDLFRQLLLAEPADDPARSTSSTSARSSKAQTKELSGGQRQRLSVALALVNDPEVVFLDEPTTGLDPAARRSLWDLIDQLRGQGKTILLTTHYMEEAEELCDRLAIMDHGRILEMGTADELIGRRFQERAVRFDTLPGARRHGPWRRGGRDARSSRTTRPPRSTPATSRPRSPASSRSPSRRGVEPDNLTIRRATLEDVFLELTGRALRD